MAGRVTHIEFLNNGVKTWIAYRRAGIELGDALLIDVRANYLVSGLGKTSSGDETYVPATDD